MQKSKQRVAMAAYESLGRMFVLETRFRLIAKQQIEDELKKTKSRVPLWVQWILRLLSGGGTV